MVIFVASALTYLLLVWAGGSIEWLEVVIALVFGGLIAVMARRWNPNITLRHSWLNPIRLGRFVLYLFGPFLVALVQANLDVAMRVITGKINPGIVRIPTGLASDGALTLLANSITLTPGTLTVDVNDESRELYVHWINVTTDEPKASDICGTFPEWARRIAE